MTEHEVASAGLRQGLPERSDSLGVAQAALDSLSAHICVLAADGAITAVNTAWSCFAVANPPVAANVGVGANYLAVCDAASGVDAASARAFADGIRSVMAGERRAFELEYPCHSPQEQRWFSGRVTPLAGRSPCGVVIAHENITARVQAEAGLQESEARYRIILQMAMDGFWLLDRHGRVLQVNEAYCQMSGYSALELQSMHISDLEAVESAADTKAHIRTIMVEGQHRFETRHCRKDGSLYDVEVSALCLPAEGGLLVGFLRDISARRQAEVYAELGREILQILNEPEDPQEALPRIMAVLKTRTGLDAVGLRLQDGDDFPYCAQEGLSPDFLRTENTLTRRDAGRGVCRNPDGSVCLECTCGLVISGQIDPAHPLFTPGGSFWTNDSLPLLDLPAAHDPRLNPRNTCIHHGYASVALVPVRSKGRIVGLIHLNGRRKGSFTRATIELLEGLAAHLGDALQRKHVEQAMRQSELQYRSMFENAPVGVVHSTVDGQIINVNAEYARIMGYDSPEELKSVANRTSAAMALYADPSERQAMVRQAQAAVGVWLKSERRYRRKDGTFVTANLVFRILPENPLLLEGFVEDITARKRAEEAVQASLQEKETLLKEIHHRVKNNLQIIISLLRLQSGQIRSPEALKAFGEMQRRVFSMALIHEMLYGSENLGQINMERYIRELGAHLFQALAASPGALRFQYDLTPVKLAIDQAIPCGLLLNELLANSLKHAFPEGRTGGEVKVEFRLVDGGPGVRLQVSDNGVGMPPGFAVERAESLGLSLATGLARQLGGRLEIGPGPGAVFSVIFTPEPR